MPSAAESLGIHAQATGGNKSKALVNGTQWEQVRGQQARQNKRVEEGYDGNSIRDKE
jgi:hypothetical protein